VKRLPEANLCALPLIASSGVQMVLGLTDTSSVQWLSLVTILLVGGGSLAALALVRLGAAHAEAFPSRVAGISCAQFAYSRIESDDPRTHRLWLPRNAG
jgi:hypothetical protein